jgi:lysyl-tRNA synthetase class 1
VFEREPPLNVAYEFLNIGGRKMSTSKGRGAAAHTIAEVIPPEQLRFLFVRPRPNQAIEFEPEGTDAIPRLFDEFDRFAAATAGKEVRGEIAPGHEATFAYSLLDPDADVAAEAAAFRPAFAHLALLLQIPNVDLAARVEAEKGGALTERERQLLDERVRAARAWLDTYAPERAIVAIRETLPTDAVRSLDEEQRRFLGTLATSVDRGSLSSGEEWQNLIFTVAVEHDLPNAKAFAALYAAFLGRTNGPRAGWLLASLDAEFVIRRLREAAGAGEPAGKPAAGATS